MLSISVMVQWPNQVGCLSVRPTAFPARQRTSLSEPAPTAPRAASRKPSKSTDRDGSVGNARCMNVSRRLTAYTGRRTTRRSANVSRRPVAA
jgi:hypothetical protein